MRKAESGKGEGLCAPRWRRIARVWADSAMLVLLDIATIQQACIRAVGLHALRDE